MKIGLKITTKDGKCEFGVKGNGIYALIGLLFSILIIAFGVLTILNTIAISFTDQPLLSTFAPIWVDWIILIAICVSFYFSTETSTKHFTEES